MDRECHNHNRLLRAYDYTTQIHSWVLYKYTCNCVGYTALNRISLMSCKDMKGDGCTLFKSTILAFARRPGKNHKKTSAGIHNSSVPNTTLEHYNTLYAVSHVSKTNKECTIPHLGYHNFAASVHARRLCASTKRWQNDLQGTK